MSPTLSRARVDVDRGVRFHEPRQRSGAAVLAVASVLLAALLGAQLALLDDPVPEGRAAASAPAPGPTTEPSDAPTPPDAGGTDAVSGPVQVVFDVGADAPTGAAEGVIDEVAAALLADGTLDVRVVGHADPSGDPDLERELSRQRALRVVDLLAVRGVQGSRAQVVAVGADEAGAAPAGGNRRVTLEVVG